MRETAEFAEDAEFVMMVRWWIMSLLGSAVLALSAVLFSVVLCGEPQSSQRAQSRCWWLRDVLGFIFSVDCSIT